MRTFLSILVLTFVLASGARTASADDLIGWSVLVESHLESINPSAFRPSFFFDVYHVVVHNPNAGDAIALELDFPGKYFSEFFQFYETAFEDGTNLPMLGPNPVAESFFVLPNGFAESDVLAIDTIDDSWVLSSSYSLPGGVSLIDGGSTATVAVLSVLTRAWWPSHIPDVSLFSGRATIDGVAHDIIFVPEPSAAILLVFGMASFALRRPV